MRRLIQSAVAVCVLFCLCAGLAHGQVDDAARKRTEKQAEALKIRFLVNPGDKALAIKLHRIYLVDLDDPATAIEYANVTGNKALSDNTQLATKAISDLKDFEARALGDWYRQFSTKAGKGAKLAMLKRAYLYYHQYFKTAAKRGPIWTRAQASSKSIRAGLLNLSVDADELTAQKPKPKPAAKALGASASFTSPDQTQGLSTVMAPGGAFRPGNVSGASALRASSAIYFKLDAGFAKGLPTAAQRIFAHVTVLDEKAGKLQLQYDGKTAPGQHSLTGSGKWVDLTFELPGAVFNGKLGGGADIAVLGAGLVLQKISIVRADLDQAGGSPQDIDLLKLVDARHDAVSGIWKLRNDGLRNQASPHARILLPIAVTGSYTLKMKVARVSGKGAIHIVFPTGKSHAMLVFGSTPKGKAFFDMELIGGQAGPRKANTQFDFLDQKVYVFQIKVDARGGSSNVAVMIDAGSSGKAGRSMAGPDNTFSLKPDWALPHTSMPGLAANNTVIHCQEALLTVTSGQPQRLALAGRSGAKGGPRGPEDSSEATRSNSQVRVDGAGFGSVLDAKKDLGEMRKDAGSVAADDPASAGQAKPDGGTMGNRGTIWRFTWPKVPGAIGYRIQVFGPKSTRPLISGTAKIPSYKRPQRGLIPNANRSGWTWRYAAVVKGKTKPWSKKYSFDVAAAKK